MKTSDSPKNSSFITNDSVSTFKFLFSGTVKQILVDNAEPVEFDQTLFVIS